MDDLISRQALCHEMYEEAFLKDSKLQKWDSGCWIRYKLFEQVVNRQQPVQQNDGSWEPVKSADGSIDFRCTSCHRYRFHNGEMRNVYKFCPNCGARMRFKDVEVK